MSIRKSPRNPESIDYSTFFSISLFPDKPPTTKIEQAVHSLNMEAFNSDLVTRIDDMLVYCFFASKKRAEHYKAFRPHAVGNEPHISADIGISIADIVRKCISSKDPTREECQRVTRALCDKYPDFFGTHEAPVIEQ
jgi:hypothetical protein